MGRKLVLAVSLWVCLQAHPALACRYNVRETGFVDLGMEPYILYAYIDSNTPARITADFKEVSQDVLADSNLRVQIINIDVQKGHPAIKFRDANDVSLPSAVLVSPDGQTMDVSLKASNKPFKETLRSAFDKILVSPKRTAILRKVAKLYGIVLLLEGPDAAENRKAKKAALAAVEEVASQLDMMPKAIQHPPGIHVLDAESVAAETMLLWTLDLEPKDLNEPHAIILYGRGRWIGPLFSGDDLNEDDIASVLFVVGADCECGLDYRWLQGTMLPARWDEKLHERAVKSLGFDPENPMIKMEMSRIIGRGLGMGRYGYSGAAFGYQELVIEPETDARQEQVQPIEEPNLASDEAEPEQEPNEAPDKPDLAIEEVQPAQEPNEAALEPDLPSKRMQPAQARDHIAIEPNLAPAGPEAVQQKGIFALRSTALLTIGMFALVIIVGIAVLARSKRV